MNITWTLWSDELTSTDSELEPGFVWCRFRCRFGVEPNQVRLTIGEYDRLVTKGSL